MSDSPAKASELQQTSLGFLNGRWVSLHEISISAADLGFRQSVTAVERMRTYNGKIFQLEAHLERWLHTVATLGIAALPSVQTIRAQLNELIDRNQTVLDQWQETGVTMFATPGVVGDEQPTFAMHLNQIDLELCDQKRAVGQPLVITKVQQQPPQSWPRGIKVRCRLHYYLADQFAATCFPGALGVLIDQDGTITETSVANVAIVESGQVVSPPAERILGGVTQSVIEQIARKQQISWSKEIISAQRLEHANEVLLMGTDAGIWFANRVSNRLINEGKPGSVFQKLVHSFDQMTVKS